MRIVPSLSRLAQRPWPSFPFTASRAARLHGSPSSSAQSTQSRATFTRRQWTSEVDELVPVADRLLGRYGADQVASLSTDQGFNRAEDRELLALYIPQVVAPKRGKLGATDQARESQRPFRALRHEHAAIESDIHGLEHHGLKKPYSRSIVGGP
jgi:hypothetical protein